MTDKMCADCIRRSYTPTDLSVVENVNINEPSAAERAMRLGIPLETGALLPNSRSTSKHLYISRNPKSVQKIREALTGQEEQIIYGSFLGGSGQFHIDPPSKNGQQLAHFVITSTIRQIPYLRWKAAKLRKLNPRIFQNVESSDVAHRVVASTWLVTEANRYLDELAKTLRDLHDRVPFELNDVGVAVWFMDAGACNEREVTLNCSQCSSSMQYAIANHINKEYSAKFKVDLNDTLRCSIDDSATFISRIRPHLLPLFYYKVEAQYTLPVVSVTKSFEIDAAHFLEDYNGKCFRTHGHLFRVEVTIQGPIDPFTGMLVDYTHIKQVVEETIVKHLDHHVINYRVPELRYKATSELLAVWIWKVLIEFFPGLSNVRVYETPTSWTDYCGPTPEALDEIHNVFKWPDVVQQENPKARVCHNGGGNNVTRPEETDRLASRSAKRVGR